MFNMMMQDTVTWDKNFSGVAHLKGCLPWVITFYDKHKCNTIWPKYIISGNVINFLGGFDGRNNGEGEIGTGIGKG